MEDNSELVKLKAKLEKDKTVVIYLPDRFNFKEHGAFDFDRFLKFFDWSFTDKKVKIDLKKCSNANYQAVSLLVLYAWKLKSQRCTVSFIESDSRNGASEMYRRLGARGAFNVLMHDGRNFTGNQFKPLFALRNSSDFKDVIEAAEQYTGNFNVEFTKTLRYVLSELLYNTLEHGQSHYEFSNRTHRIPSLCQFSYFKNKNEVSFIIADVGIGIKKHLEQAYPGQVTHEEAILKAMKPQVSGTFGKNDPYKDKNNAGIGLFISTNIIRRLNADMHILSGNGLIHISPRDITNKRLDENWPGTFVLVTIKLDNNPFRETLDQMLQGFRQEALVEQRKADGKQELQQLYVNISNYFGFFAEDKDAAIRFRNERIFPALAENKTIQLDFDGVESSPHSFLSALLASPIKSTGMNAYKIFKIINATPDVRETVDFILDENTE
ncbi:DUF4325 domain-containing protein [Psychrosphaera aquimarina]|uniref:DUF4325 domain-containing protein n=1 Tax=Psychrosphaera aquimarina TaxID=2044854 RepID=A0ABU3R0J9_9GAMM|nr:DUF4325 domain-containing protein [Psychrosphaera aquimarina]MDU0113212.1 DUF4325 domain-containing protein [Psychrosphaera aquimarina]